jgi:hypothetical protein
MTGPFLGVDESFIEPLPNCPTSLAPQQRIVPSKSKAQLYSVPAAILTAAT